MSHRPDENFREQLMLSQRASGKDKTLALTACLDPELREIIGIIEAYQEYENNDEFEKEKEALRIYARYKWPRTEITDLGFIIGENTVNVNYDKDNDESAPTNSDSEEDL